jgi:N-acetylmuramoyl-L-alanine amidase
MTLIIDKNNMLDITSITHLVIHCSDTGDNVNIGAEEIHKMHLNFGWDGIGYHKVICRDGSVQNGRPEYWKGAHVKGLNNHSLGVCLIGSKNFTVMQFNSLEKTLLDWKKKYFPVIILGHRDAVQTHKTCPNFDVLKWCNERDLS